MFLSFLLNFYFTFFHLLLFWYWNLHVEDKVNKVVVSLILANLTVSIFPVTDKTYLLIYWWYFSSLVFRVLFDLIDWLIDLYILRFPVGPDLSGSVPGLSQIQTPVNKWVTKPESYRSMYLWFLLVLVWPRHHFYDYFLRTTYLQTKVLFLRKKKTQGGNSHRNFLKKQ